MDSYERVMTAITGEKPHRVPVIPAARELPKTRVRNDKIPKAKKIMRFPLSRISCPSGCR